MPHERPLNDLDRELRDLLAIEPSPEFAVGIRARVAEQAMAGGWRPPVWLAAAAVLVLSAGLGLVMLTPGGKATVVAPAEHLPVGRGEEPVPLAPVAALVPAATAAVPSAEPRRVGTMRSSQPLARATAADAQAPVIVIDPRQREVVAGLFDDLRRSMASGRGVKVDEMPAETAIADMEPAPIAVEPMVVEAIPVTVVESGTVARH
jgi:hypothetical protein